MTVGGLVQNEGAAHALAPFIAAACGGRAIRPLCRQGLHGGARAGC